MKPSFILTAFLCVSIASKVWAQSKPIALTFIDGDTGCPIEGFQVDVVGGTINNAGMHMSSSKKKIGVSDENGYVEGSAPLSISGFSAHGESEAGFILYFSRPNYDYSEWWDDISADTTLYDGTVVVSLPFVHELRAITDVTKSFIEIQYRSRKGPRLYYYNGEAGNQKFQGGSIFKGLSSNSLSSVFTQAQYAVDELVTFKDTDVQVGSSYSYAVTDDDYSSSVQFTLALNENTPAVTTLLPKPSSRPCSSSLYAEHRNFGKVITGESVTMNLKVHGTGDDVQLSSLNLPGFLSSDFTGVTVTKGSTISIPVKFSPTEAKRYDGKIGLVSNGKVISEVGVAGEGTPAPIILGVQKSTDAEFISFPNPYDKNLTIVKPSLEPTTVSVYSSLGVLLFRKSISGQAGAEHILDLSDLPSGMQILQVSSAGQVLSRLISKR